MGSVTLDLREARLRPGETVITALAVITGIDVMVNPGTRRDRRLTP